MARSSALRYTLVVLFYTLGAVAAFETSLPGIDRIPDPGRGLGALLMVLTPSSVALRNELDISDPQLRSLDDLKKSYMKRSMEITRKLFMQKGDSAGAMKEERVALDEVATSLEKLLRPEQFHRLRQLRLQYSTKSLLCEPLAWSAVMTELDLSRDEQIRFAREVRSRGDILKKRTAERTESVPKTLNGLVTVEQRQKLDELCGEPVRTIEFSSFTVGSGSNSKRGKGLSHLFDRVRDPSVKKELELVKDQDDQLDALYLSNFRDERTIYSKHDSKRIQAGLRGVPESGPLDKELEALRERYDLKVVEILLPHQVKRLHQLHFQLRVGAESHIPLLSKTAAVALGLTDEKQRELQEAYLRESDVVKQETDRLFYEALDELIRSLSIDQQKRYHLLVGKRFDKWYE
jgi:hypothetical protein